jgi:hypothetical protein
MQLGPSRKRLLSRRRFLSGTATLVGVGSAFRVMPRFALAKEPSETTASPLVKQVVRSPENTYFTYPHSNGFLPNGTPVFASPTGAADVDYIACNPESPGEARKITHVREARLYYSISKNGLMVISKQHGGVALLDMTAKNDAGREITPLQIFHEEGWDVPSDNDITVDGRQVLITRTLYDTEKKPLDGRMDVIDIASGEVKNLIKGRMVDHAHYSPFDPKWISFCDNAPDNLDRMWVWNEAKAPNGRHVFDQMTPKGYYLVTHERAMFDKPAILTCAYGFAGNTHAEDDAVTPGLFEVGFDGSLRLVSPSRRDFHCNISRDGRWAVVSLEGQYDAQNRKRDARWENSSGEGWGYSDVMVVNMRTGRREFLYRGTSAAQPYEVQPTISPDGKWVLLKDAREKRVLMVEINQTALKSFLAA